MPLLDPESFIISSTSDFTAITTQLIDLVPASWTPSEARRSPGIFWALMSAIGLILAVIKAQVVEAKKQIKLLTASGSYLDTIGRDFFGTTREFGLFRQV